MLEAEKKKASENGGIGATKSDGWSMAAITKKVVVSDTIINLRLDLHTNLLSCFHPMSIITIQAAGSQVPFQETLPLLHPTAI